MFCHIKAIPEEMEFLKNDIKQLFIAFVNPQEEKHEKRQEDFFDVLIQTICKDSKTKTFGEIFDSVCAELPGSVGFTNTPDFDFQLRLCEKGFLLQFHIYSVLNF